MSEDVVALLLNAPRLAFVPSILATVVLYGLIRYANGLAQFANAIHQKLVDALYGLDLFTALMFEIVVGEGVGDGGGGSGIRRLRLDAEDVRTLRQVIISTHSPPFAPC
jgi:hypothetical protein